MTELVVGGCGFIGSHLVDVLLSRGKKVRVFDKNPERFRLPLADVHYIYGDLRDQRLLGEALKDVSVVYHLATTSFPSNADSNPASDVESNLISTLNLMDLCCSLGIRRFVFLSSGGTVYGIPEIVPIPESHPITPIGSYGIVKAAIEFYLSSYMKRGLLDPVIVRASNPYGPRQGHAGVQGVISTFLHNAKNGESLAIWGDGSVVRDFIYVTDLVDLCFQASEIDFNGPINAGSGTGLSILEIVHSLEHAIGRAVDVRFLASSPVDVPISVLDIKLVKKLLKWSPIVSIDEGLAKTWDWMRRQPPY